MKIVFFCGFYLQTMICSCLCSTEQGVCWNKFNIFQGMMYSSLLSGDVHESIVLGKYLDPVRQLPSPLTTDTLLVSIVGTAIG